MTRHRMLSLSERWFRLLQHMYPSDFRDELGRAVIEEYMDRARDALNTGGRTRLVALWVRALLDSLRNGPAEWVRPAASWRRAGAPAGEGRSSAGSGAVPRGAAAWRCAGPARHR